MAQVAFLYRYPVKGFSADPLDTARLEKGRGIPLDRAYAVENGRSRFDAEAPRWLSKVSFLMLMRHERLASLRTVFDPDDHMLTIYRGEKQVARGALRTKLGRQMIEQFLASYLQAELKGPPRILSAEGHSFTDISEPALHLVNLETVRDLEARMGVPLDPLRFRANLYFERAAAWAEMGWIGRTLRIGPARIKVFDVTARCAATDVDPRTGQRGVSVPASLERNYGHSNVGVYARVTEGGTIERGDVIELDP
jgi:uncharacterized protein YcbX